MCKNCAGLPGESACGEDGTESAAEGGLGCDGAFSQSLRMTACTRFETTRRSSANRHSKPSPSRDNSPETLRACSASVDDTTLFRRSNTHCGVVTTRLLCPSELNKTSCRPWISSVSLAICEALRYVATHSGLPVFWLYWA